MNVASILPIAIPILRRIVGNSGHKQLVDMLDRNQGVISTVLSAIDSKDAMRLVGDNQDAIVGLLQGLGGPKTSDNDVIKLLIDKLPDSNSSNVLDRLNNIEEELSILRSMIVKD